MSKYPCGFERKTRFDCGRSDDEHVIEALRAKGASLFALLDRNTNSGAPVDPDTGECYYCERGILREDGDEDCTDHLESPAGHKPECAWRQAREFIAVERDQEKP